MQPERVPAWESLLRLFHDGFRLEQILSGWKLTEEKIAELLLAAHREGEKIAPEWLLPDSIRRRVVETIQQHPELSAVEISSRFQGKVAPALIRVVREVEGPRSGLETRILTERTAPELFDADIHGAQAEILLVTPHVKGQHWRRYEADFKRVIDLGGTVAFFSPVVSDLVREDLKTCGVVLIEKRTNAALALIDGLVLWEGSWSFLGPPTVEEHVRRTRSRLQCDEIKDLHDLFV